MSTISLIESSQLQIAAPPVEQVGLLAGGGTFPIEFARRVSRRGVRVYGLGVEGMASDDLPEACFHYSTVPLGRIGQAIRHFRRLQIDRVVMAGKIEKTVLFQPWRLLRMLPDWRTIHMWFTYAAQNRKDDTLLLAVIREFERDGIRFESALDFCPEILVKHGFLTRRRPTSAQWRDIRFGWELAREMGRLDVGQSVMVNDMAVLAVEAIEGTDRAIRRAGELCRRGGFTVVKIAKPHQDMRFDVPTIGIQTIHTMHESGGRVLAVEADKTIILDEENVISLADTMGIAVVALNAEEAEMSVAA